LALLVKNNPIQAGKGIPTKKEELVKQGQAEIFQALGKSKVLPR
jgi:hypothetical protein